MEQPEAEPKDKTPVEMRVSSDEESTDLPVFAERPQRPNTRTPTDRHNVFTHFPQTIRIVKSVSSRRLPEFRAETARNHEETVFFYLKFLVIP